MGEWPKSIYLKGSMVIAPSEVPVEVVPAEWYEKRTDLARELYEALCDLRQDYNPSTAKVADQAIARFEREVVGTRCPTCGSDDPEYAGSGSAPANDEVAGCTDFWHEQEVGE